MPAGLMLMPGDYVDFRWGTFQRALVRVLEKQVVSSGVVAVSIEPPVNTQVVPADGSAVAHLDNPACLMRIITSQTNIGAFGRRGPIESGTVVAIQDLVP
jgi:hypothetical protein